jgi:hypothetical protein
MQHIHAAHRPGTQGAISLILAWTEPLTPLQRVLRRTTLAVVRKAVKQADSLTSAAAALGTTYRSLARWRADHPELTTEHQGAAR